jgi:hypothetical protein
MWSPAGSRPVCAWTSPGFYDRPDLKNADTAMFRAKGTKKRVVLFRESH